MELLKHFEEEKKTLVLLTLKDGEWNDFVKKLPAEYIESYIPAAELKKRIDNFASSKKAELSEILPSVGNIRSGDFGEILAYLLFKERHKSTKIDGPRKWRWKQEKNVAAPYTDVILYSIADSKKPTKNDTLLSVESKMKATTSKSYHPIQNAIDGAHKDYVSRIANSLSWIRKKYKDESLKVNANLAELNKLISEINRFIKSETVGEYTKEIRAVAIVDKTFFKEEVGKKITIPTMAGANLEIHVVSICNLKNTYEQVFDEIPKI